MAVSSEQQNFVGIRRVWQGSHAPKGPGAVMQGMGGHGDGGFGEWHAAPAKPGVGKKVMHPIWANLGPIFSLPSDQPL
jgi:hypothetical protein